MDIIPWGQMLKDLLAGNIIFLAQIWVKKLKVMRETKRKRDEEKERYISTVRGNGTGPLYPPWRPPVSSMWKTSCRRNSSETFISPPPAFAARLAVRWERIPADYPFPPAPRFLPQSSGGLAEDRWYPPWRVAIYTRTLPPLLVPLKGIASWDFGRILFQPAM